MAVCDARWGKGADGQKKGLAASALLPSLTKAHVPRGAILFLRFGGCQQLARPSRVESNDLSFLEADATRLAAQMKAKSRLDALYFREGGVRTS